MKTSTWNNGAASRGRLPRAVVITADGSAYRFTGESIPGVCASALKKSEKCGKWSNADFLVSFADTSTFVSWIQDWETGETFPQPDWDSGYMWLQAQAPQLRRDAFVEFVRANWPDRASHWDAYEAELAKLDAPAPAPLIVTRHAGLVAWLSEHNVTGDVVEQATADIVRGRDVIGVLPMWLAAEARTVTSIDLPRLPQGRRATELTAAEMDEYGAVMRRYVVREVAK